MGAERIAVDQLVGVKWTRAWRSGAATVRLGETADYRWVAWHSGKGRVHAFWTEREACIQGDAWLARGVWAAVKIEQAETTAV